MELKLQKLPNRTRVRIPLTVTPDLNITLTRYADYYAKAYGQTETVPELIPYMLQSFIESDRGFSKAVKEEDARTKG